MTTTETCVATIPAHFDDGFDDDFFADAPAQAWAMEAFAAARAPQPAAATARRPASDRLAAWQRAAQGATAGAARSAAARTGYWWVLALSLAGLVVR
jgi:hypothetical protein